MIGIVLAAGASQRLQPLTSDIPKTLLPLEGKRTLLEYSLSNLSDIGCTAVAIVVGYRASAIEQQLPSIRNLFDMDIELIHNRRAERWNNAYSLYCAREVLAQGAFVVNGDTLHPQSVERLLLEHSEIGVSLAVDPFKSLGGEEMKVTIGDDGLVRQISKGLDPRLADAEFIGVSLVDAHSAPSLIACLEATWRRDPSQYYEAGYQALIVKGHAVRAFPIEQSPWIEVDTPSDLVRAREIACQL